jgi:hypothetical protein
MGPEGNDMTMADSRSCVYDAAGNLIETHEQAERFLREAKDHFFLAPCVCSLVISRDKEIIPRERTWLRLIYAHVGLSFERDLPPVAWRGRKRFPVTRCDPGFRAHGRQPISHLPSSTTFFKRPNANGSE